MKNVNLTDHFLIAMPAMTDPYFAKSLTYVCEHTEQGALGVVINKPIEMTMKMLLDQVGIELEAEFVRRIEHDSATVMPSGTSTSPTLATGPTWPTS